MKLRTRFTLIGIGITIFIILAPILVFYARGFKYDFSTGQVIKTGTLIMRTEPEKARVFLNSDTKAITTPANIRFLTPGEYNIRAEKTGYQTWQKRLSVVSQFVTWGNLNRDNIFLLLKEPKLTNSYPGTSVATSSDRSEIAYTHEGVEYFLRPSNGSRETLGQTSSIRLPLPAHATIDWANAAQIWQLLQTTDAWPLTANEVEDINGIYTNGRRTAVLTNGNLSSFEITEMTPLAENVTAVLLNNEELWFISSGVLRLYNFGTKTFQTIAEGLPTTNNAQIIRGSKQVYVIAAGELYYVQDTVQKVYSPVTFARWYEDAGKLLYGNGNEAYLHEPLTNRSELAFRSISPILDAQLSWSTGYLFYVHEGKIKAAELDTRNGQNQFDILSFENSRSFVLSQDGKRLYLIKADGILEYEIR